VYIYNELYIRNVMVTSNTQWFMYFCKYLEDPC